MRLTESYLRKIIRLIIKEATASEGLNVSEIIENTPKEYLEKTLSTRNPGGSIQAGSVFLEPQTAESLSSADWKKINHEAVKSPAVAFTASIPGVLGIVPIENLSDSTPVKFQLSHGGKGGKSGNATEVVAQFDKSLGKVDSTTLIAGPTDDDPKKYEVWTFHPGDPVAQSDEININDVKKKYPEGKATVADSKKLGFKFVKRVESLSEARSAYALVERWQRLAGIL